MKNRSFPAARLLPAAALLTSMLMLFSSCQLLRPVDGDVLYETANLPETEGAAGTDTEAPTAEPTEAPEPETTASAVDRTAEDIYLAHPELTPVNYDSPALLPRTEDAGQEYIDNLTFLCDSPFFALKIFGLLSDGYDTTQIWTGPEGTMTLGYLHGFGILDPIDNVERTISEAVALHKPPVIMITVGINGVALWEEDKFKEEYVWLINEIRTASPDTVILANSILPISPVYVNWGMFTNAMITDANAWILEVAEQCGIHYLDTFSVLVGEDGNIRPEYVQDDGLHPNPEGLKVVLSYIRTHAYLP